MLQILPRKLRSALTLTTALALLTTSGCHRSSSHHAAAQSAATSSFDADIAIQWFELLYDVVKSTPLSPPVAARAYGYAGVTLYESVVPGMATHRSLKDQLNDFDGVPQPTGIVDYPLVASTALAAVIKGGAVPGIKPADVTKVDNLATSIQNTIQATVAADVFQRSIDLGNDIAAAILTWLADDGFTQFNGQPYTPPVGTGLWVPLTGQTALQPYWDQLRPFVLVPASECSPGAPHTYSEVPGNPFRDEADEVYNTTGDAGVSLTATQREIGWFWSDGPTATGTPPGHWVSIVTQIVENDDENLETAAEAYAKVGIAVADAFISCWQAKYQYNLERPITYIRRVIDPNWDPMLATPGFPEYTSGHSVQSGAAAAVLESVFPGRGFTDDTHNRHANAAITANAPNARTFATFLDAANEAAISRLYGGIHFRKAIDGGVVEGQDVASVILGSVEFLK